MKQQDVQLSQSKNGDSIDVESFGLVYSGQVGDESTRAIQELSFSARHGEILTIVGPSGCGKTSLLRSIGALSSRHRGVESTSGSISVFGLSPDEAKCKRMFAFVFQGSTLLPWRTVRQNVSLPFEILLRNEGGYSDHVNGALQLVGMSEFSNAMPSQLSGGMRQRVNLARALAQKPQILLMDEPFGSLDEVSRERLNFELLEIHKKLRTTILFVTHSISEAVLLADKVLVMSRRPARVVDIVPVELPRERTYSMLMSSEFHRIVATVRNLLESGDRLA